MRIVLVSLALLVTLAAATPAQGGSSASAAAHVFLMAGVGGTAARTVAVTQLDAAVTAEMQGATHATVRVRTQAATFAIARLAAQGQVVGSTLVQVNGTTKTLADVAASLQAAADGTLTLALFTRGSRGVVVSLTSVTEAAASTPLVLADATHASLIVRGHLRTFVIVPNSGQTLATIRLRSEASAQSTSAVDEARAEVSGGMVLEVVAALEGILPR